MGVLSLGAELPMPVAALWACLLLWVVASLSLAYGVFRRRPA
jgi:Cu-processing system permease protein